RAPEVDGMVFKRFPLDHQPIARRLLDRFVQFKALAALGAQEQRTRLGDRGLKVLLGAGLDVDLGDFGNHRGCDLMRTIPVSNPTASRSQKEKPRRRRGRALPTAAQRNSSTEPATSIAQPMNMTTGQRLRGGS